MIDTSYVTAYQSLSVISALNWRSDTIVNLLPGHGVKAESPTRLHLRRGATEESRERDQNHRKSQRWVCRLLHGRPIPIR